MLEELSMKTLQLTLAAAAMLMFSSAAFARATQDAQSGQQSQEHAETGHGQGTGEGHGRGMMMSPDAMLDHLSTELNLTDDQKTKIKPILEEQSKQMQQLRQDSSSPREERRAKMKQIHESTMTQVRPILNADQQKKLEEMMSRRPERGEKGHGEAGQDSNPKPQ
jgi:periplasmic protein CpxP/Spy